LVFARFDIGLNDYGDYPPQNIKNLPALVLYRAANKSHPLTFTNPDYSDDAIVSWIKDNASSFRSKKKKASIPKDEL